MGFATALPILRLLEHAVEGGVPRGTPQTSHQKQFDDQRAEPLYPTAARAPRRAAKLLYTHHDKTCMILFNTILLPGAPSKVPHAHDPAPVGVESSGIGVQSSKPSEIRVFIVQRRMGTLPPENRGSGSGCRDLSSRGTRSARSGHSS
jgi:hypothetical protein